ncbi:zinc-dependent alcohol dehydrogenase [Pseudolysinimonas sp.]|uniref:zinc-dependent alcohol dehydrogenase n=1 Tax=Pseudolysinimonas sp. TaxID=2680009 RepID=UPI003F7E6A02
MSAVAEPRVGGRVLTLTAPRELRLVESPAPEPGPGEARVRIRAVGICGTDVHGYLGRAERFPTTLGHDAVGTVDALGPGVTGPELGDRVTIDPTIACGACPWCTAGGPQLCATGSYLGMTSAGTMADLVVVPADRLVAVPAALDDVDATALEPVAVALHLLDRIGDFAPAGRHAEVVGGGPLGVLLAQTLQARGWTALLHEPQPARRAIAADLGLAVADGSAAAAAAEGPILVVDTSASAPGIELARRLANRGSVIALIGRASADIPVPQILGDELTVVGVKSGAGRYPEAIELVSSGAVTPRATVTHSYDLADADRAFAEVTDPAAQVMRAVLRTDTADKDRP